MLTAARPYPDSIHQQSKNPLNPEFVNQIRLFNKQRYKRSDSSSEGEQLLRNAELHRALRKKNLSEEKRIELIEQSLKKGADINSSDSTKDNNTPLHTAVQKGYAEVVEFLLQKGASIALKNNNQNTPKDLAKDNPEIINIFEKFSFASENHPPLIVQESLIPNGFKKGTAVGGGDCFFDTLAQGMNQLFISGGPFDVQSLRNDCAEYARDHADSIVQNTNDKTWRKMIADDANAGGYATEGNGKQDNFNSYLVGIQLTPESGIADRQPVWGRPEIEGRMLCQKYGIKLHLIEKLTANNEEVIGHQLIDATGSKSINVEDNLYRDAKIVHLLNEGQAHFEPILPKLSVSNTPIVKTQQTIDNQYLRTLSLTDAKAWADIAAKKEDPTFKILKITNSPTASDALQFMRQASFYQTFNQATHWFLTVIQVDDSLELKEEDLGSLAAVLDAQKPMIIQWNSILNGNCFISFKESHIDHFTTVDLNHIQQFSSEEELITALYDSGTFKFPLLLKALNSELGGKLNGNLLKTVVDIGREFDTWRLIDYAARDDDSLSLRLFLLLAQWDLTKVNEAQERTLEIAAEQASPESLSALLDLPFSSSVSNEELFLSSPAKELLGLTNGENNTPLLIAAQQGKTENLDLLIRCGADIHYRKAIGGKSFTAINLAWNGRHYANVRSLLEADSLFPDGFSLDRLGDSKDFAALKQLTEERQDFHQAIKENLKDRVKNFIKTHPRLKQAYDPSNQSALIAALDAERYEMYALLQSQGYVICP